MRRAWRSFLGVLAGVILAVTAPAAHASADFVHPGLLHSRADLERMVEAVAAKREPIYAGFETFRASPASRADYRMRGPAVEIGRSPTVATAEFDSDANAAYQCALMAWITGDAAYADKAREILNAWSARLQRVTGADAVLMAGLGPFKLVNAAELLRYSPFGWADDEVARARKMFREAIYPTLRHFAPFANGNWDTAAIKTVAAIAVFCDDRPMFEQALRYYVDGWGDGALTHYIINETGQCQESGRDMPHTQLGLAHLGDTCEIAWHQGLDLYGYADNRLLKGFEYTARYNLGEDVPFVETLDRTGKYHHVRIATAGRGRLRPVYEEILHHYVSRRGLQAPWTAQAAAKLRPEGPSAPAADHPGFGTLLFTRTTADAEREQENRALLCAPSGLDATGGPESITVTWIPVIGATGYAIERAAYDPATQTWSPNAVVAENVSGAMCRDATVAAGALYRYTVTARDGGRTSVRAYPVVVSAGLPPPWRLETIGAAPATQARFDGTVMRIEAGGRSIGSVTDEMAWLYSEREGDGTISARYLPIVSSQKSQFGVMLRASSAVDAPFVALLFVPDHSRETERPGWAVKLVTRGAERTSSSAGAVELHAPTVAFGRLVQPCWVRLARKDHVVTALTSADGNKWEVVGQAELTLPSRTQFGVAACSGVAGLTTTVRFAEVAVKR